MHRAASLLVVALWSQVGAAGAALPQADSDSTAVNVRQIAPEAIVTAATLDSSPQLNSPDPQRTIREDNPPRHRLGVPGPAVPAVSARKAKANPEVEMSFNGRFSRYQRIQGLCTGNGYVLESVNSAVRIFDVAGNAMGNPVALNAFYGLPPRIDFATGRRGPITFDPSCYFDAQTSRWFHLLSALERDPVTNRLSGKSHIDLAVSQSPDPRGAWMIYRIPGQNDGTDGTPDHRCSFGPCFPDFPHLGADAYGIYISTDEFSFFGPEFKSANIYALSKKSLVAGGPVTVVQFETPQSSAGVPGLTVLGAISPPGQFQTDNGGTEFFLSSDAALTSTGTSDHLILWKLTNTSSLDSPNPTLSLSNSLVSVSAYSIPPASEQKVGDIPLGTCLSVDCFGFGFTIPVQGPGQLPSGISRVTRVYYGNGKLWTTLGTAVGVGDSTKAGIGWYVVNPDSAKVVKQGTLALAGSNLTFPSAAVTASGRGVITFTVVGPDYYPSTGYVSLDATNGAGDVHIVANGAGPQDGLTEYFPPPSWGDYSAAATDWKSIWIGSEIISQSCTFQEFLNDPTCGGTRAPLANWGTRLSKLVP